MPSSRGISQIQGLNPPFLHWQVDSLPLSHLGSPRWRRWINKNKNLGRSFCLFTKIYMYMYIIYIKPSPNSHNSLFNFYPTSLFKTKRLQRTSEAVPREGQAGAAPTSCVWQVEGPGSHPCSLRTGLGRGRLSP